MQSEQNYFFRILDYLLGLHRGLSSATFPDEFARDRSARSLTLMREDDLVLSFIGSSMTQT